MAKTNLDSYTQNPDIGSVFNEIQNPELRKILDDFLKQLGFKEKTEGVKYLHLKGNLLIDFGGGIQIHLQKSYQHYTGKGKNLSITEMGYQSAHEQLSYYKGLLNTKGTIGHITKQKLATLDQEFLSPNDIQTA